VDKIKGRVKEAAGALLADKRLKREGQADQLAGNLKQAAEKVVDDAKNLVKGRPMKGRPMKGLAIVAAASAFAFCATTAAAGVIYDREQNQRDRIHEGVQSGQLTSKETTRLHAEQRAIRAERARALADGKITRPERRSIRHDQNQASRDIRREKNNWRYYR
jgi:uncharacterized protein YjbJ (UPF0337 family)